MECESCRSLDPVTLHNIPHRGTFAFLCTACVLRHHAGTFCPFCFDIHDYPKRSSLPDHSRVMCFRCPAMAHVACLSSARSSTFRFVCPQCADPSFAFFDFGNVSSVTRGSGGKIAVSRDLPKQLLCAAKIASASMHRAASIARDNAEQKVREAVVARKRAKEAIERVTHLMANQQAHDDDSDVENASSG